MKARTSSRWAFRSLILRRGSRSSRRCRSERRYRGFRIGTESMMSRFNLSAWAVAHPALMLFLIVMLGAAGLFSYRSLGRGEDPSFTIKVVIVTAIWPGATAAEMQTQVADPIEKKMQELPFI